MRYAYLIKVDGEANNNKYYEMIEESDRIVCKAGRVGYTPRVYTYPRSKWDSKYQEKIGRKGYKDHTEYRVETTTTDVKIETDSSDIRAVFSRLYRASGQSVSDNYNVSAGAVTQQQVDDAQGLIDASFSTDDPTVINRNLQRIYQIIPRQMSSVSDYLIEPLGIISRNRARDFLVKEQDRLDALAQRVTQHIDTGGDEEANLFDVLGITVEEPDDHEVYNIKRMAEDSAHRIVRVLRVTHHDSNERYERRISSLGDGHDTSQMFWHGSRTENWLSIIKKGLVIRPAGVHITGAMFGHGIYFADRFQKSAGYTSARGSYWASGNSDVGYLAVFDVNTGVPLKIRRWDSWCYDLNRDYLRKKGDYDSVEGARGADLINNEYIVYTEAQATVRYLIEFS